MPRMTRTLLKSILFTFVVLSGCVSEQEPLPVLSLYQNYSQFRATDDEVSDSADIKNKDSLSPSDKTEVMRKEFTLDQAIQTALNTDPRISAALENIRQAVADLTTAGLIPNPDLSASGSLMPLDKRFTVDRQGGPPQFDVGVAMPIDWFLFGKRAAAITSWEYGVDAASADFANTIRLRIAATIGAFYDVLEAQAMLELVQENQKNLAAMEKIIINRVALGGVGTIEADRIKLSLFASRREVHTQELNLSAALNRLKTLLGISANPLLLCDPQNFRF